MKAEDLMIGDWATFNHLYDGINHKVMTKIVIIGGQNILTEYGQSNGDNLQPIELTEEILEKNGFTSVEDKYNHKKYFLLGKNEYNCDVYWDGLTILLVEEDYEPTTYAYVCDVKYVHELQHALKLCKIKKEIVL